MSLKEKIATLKERGFSYSLIAKGVKCHRNTISRYMANDLILSEAREREIEEYVNALLEGLNLI